ncbi:hypothetical protein EIB75_01235 [Epilithonimonas vandammei]|uniref:Uncharacterized protein n=1 Tax=Epilithonimonas vandammei TaxID=2487072 RepID=A0A3G8Z8R0_9FLAO|nr:hypothetical protein [Epilithonimonas vandammei]AZI53962.1 hypothetical protein EIB75_01235 [Epilithonimonas vandammei]
MVNSLIHLFTENQILNHIDNFKQYEYIAYVTITDNTKLLNRPLYDNINNYFKSLGYDWSLEIDENSYSISQNTFNDLEFDDLTDTPTLKLTIKVFKLGNKIIIFNQNVFFETLNKMSLKSILSIFQEATKPILIENSFTSIFQKTNIIGYNSNIEVLENKEISIQCLFYNYSEFKFTPENFSLNNSDNLDDFGKIIQKLHLVYLLIFLFDVSEIKDNNIFLKLKGHKTYDYELDFSTFTTDSINEYRKIYEWIYADKEKIEDKLGIARNIIGFYLKKDDIKLDNRAFPSILSANQLYIKGNLTKYLDSRNKIYEQVEQVTNKINASLDTFLGNFQKSVFVFVSFYLTAFVVKIFSKSDVSTAIGKEATLFGIGILLLSVIFLLFSLVVLNSDLKRANEKYNLVKKRFEDILNKDDVEKILNSDSEFKKDIEFYEKRRCRFIILWLSTIIILVCILFSTSDYINFKYLFE